MADGEPLPIRYSPLALRRAQLDSAAANPYLRRSLLALC
jgi:hypothetical protein